MEQGEFLNVFRGPRSVANFYNPSLQPPLPLIEIPDSLNPFRNEGVRIFAKLMTSLPAHNVKSLPALNMLLGSENLNKKTNTIVEQSSGSTVISLSLVARIYYGIDDVRAYITNKTSAARMKMLRFFGLQLILYGGPHQPEPFDPRGGIEIARKLGEDESILNPNQYENDLNPDAHVRWTGPQLLKQIPEINVFCAPMGTGGVITGTAGYLKSSKPSITVVGVCNASGDPVPGPRPFALFEHVRFPWRKVVDAVEHISSKDSYHLSILLSREGLICGPSSGMTLKGLYNFLQQEKDTGQLMRLAGPNGTLSCVFMCCDLPYQYLDDYFNKLGPEVFKPIVNENLIYVDTHLYDSRWEIDYCDAMVILSKVLGEPLVKTGGFLSNNQGKGSNGSTLCREAALSQPPPVLVDFRSSVDFAQGHISVAVNQPLKSLKRDDKSPYEDSNILEAQWLELEAIFDGGETNHELWRKFKGRSVVLVCYGGDTARVASSVLRSRGIEAVSIKGGMISVIKAIVDITNQRRTGNEGRA